ncbi:hypothetical protein FQA39_LY08657 [Lamprigera yunnana]|nr:hypothetical protein FQA39_LY08657 [Lamprigera yunnana]
MIDSILLGFRNAVTNAIEFGKQGTLPIHVNADFLRKDILIEPQHVLGDHNTYDDVQKKQKQRIADEKEFSTVAKDYGTEETTPAIPDMSEEVYAIPSSTEKRRQRQNFR